MDMYVGQILTIQEHCMTGGAKIWMKIGRRLIALCDVNLYHAHGASAQADITNIDGIGANIYLAS